MYASVNRIIYFGVAYSSIRMLVGAISAVYMLAYGLDIVDIAMVKAFQAGVILLLDIPLAYVADKKSRKLSVLVAGLFAVLWLFTMGAATTLPMFYLAEFFNAVSIALFGGSFVAYLIDKNESTHSGASSIQQVLGRFGKYQYMGMGVAALIGSAFIGVDSKVVWFVASGLLGVLILISLLMLPKDTQQQSTDVEVSPFSEVFGIFKDIALRAEIKWIAGTLILLTVYYQLIIQFWQVVLTTDNGDAVTKGYVYGTVFVVILFAQSFSGYLLERLARKWIVAVIAFSTVPLALFPVLAAINLMYATIAIIVLLFFVLRLANIALQSSVQENISSSLRASYDSVISTIARVVLLLTMPLFGFTLQHLGFTVFYAPYLGAAAAILTIITLRQRKR